MPNRKKLPIPLTCRPQIEEGKCVHGLDNGACELPDQFPVDKHTRHRFWSKVQKTKCCWVWTGARSPSSGVNAKWPYGSFVVVATAKGRRIIKAHHYAWYLKYGTLPEDKLLHRCDNTLCVRPKHLFEGSQKDNMQDCLRKGRLVNPPNLGLGETHWMNDSKKKKAWEKKRWTTQRRAEAAERMRTQWTPAQRRQWVRQREAARAAAKGSRSR
jgi:hypothetical protein